MKSMYQQVKKQVLFSIVFVVVISILTSSAIAKSVSKEKAGKAANAFLVNRYPSSDPNSARTITKRGKSFFKIKEVQPLVVSGKVVGYINKMEPSGFILLSADDQAPPIKIYSDEGSFDNLPQGLLKVLELELLEDNEYLKSKKPKDKVKLKKYQDLWTSLSLDEDSGLSTSAADSAILNTTWDQPNPYNYYCPTAGNGRALTGCTATALGQILRHHNSPERVTSDHTYTDSSGSCKGTHSISDAGMGSYDWANMPSAISTSSPEVQQQAVGQLMFHCGVALESNYEAGVTSAYPSAVPGVLQTYFNYTSSNYQNKSSYTSAAWYNKISDDIDDNLPVFYAMWELIGTEWGNGHAVVCDGYRNGNEIHLDLGWSGAWTAWYNIDSVSASGFTWTRHSAVFDIAPTGDSTPVLSNPQVSPTSGTENTNFKYTVHYYDADGDVPGAYARVYIDGQYHQMSLESGSPANGDYSYTTQLGLGTHTYSFAFINANGFDSTPTYSNPYVHTVGCGVEIDVEVSGGPVTNNIEIEFEYGPDLFNMVSQQWYAPELPQDVWIDPGQQLMFSISVESLNHTFTKWEFRDDEGNLVRESTAAGYGFILNSGNIHATAYLSYTPIDYTISGTIHRDDSSAIPGGVDLILTSSQQTLNQHISSTSFSFTGVDGGVPVSVTYEATDGGYAFTPTSLSWGNLKSNNTGEDVTAYSSDTSVPITSFIMLPPAVSEDSAVSFSWTGEDDVSATENLMYQYKLDGVDVDWSLWAIGTSISYNVENGEYTFWVRAKDEAENINQAPTNYTFAVDAAPKVISAERISRSIWASQVTLEMPVGASNPTDSFVLLPEHSGMNDSELIPVAIHSANDPCACGANENVAGQLGLATRITAVESGWLVTLPESIPSGQTVQYDIVWGKIKYFGWQEFVSVPAGFPNGGSEQRAYLDDNLIIWRSVLKEDPHTSSSFDNDSWVFMDACNKDDIIINENILRYVLGESWGGYAGTSTEFSGCWPFKAGSNICYLWTDYRYEDYDPPYYDYRRYGLQILDSAGSTVNSFDGTYYDRTWYALPTQLVHGSMWILAEESGATDSAWFLVLNATGSEVISKTVFDTISTTSSGLDVKEAQPLGTNIAFLWERYWDTSLGYVRQELAYEVWNTSGSPVKDRTILSQTLLSDSIEEEDEFIFDSILADNEGKVWVSYYHYSYDQGGEIGYYYSILGTDGNVWKGPITTINQRSFNFCDKNGYIWATENGQFLALNPDDTTAVSPRANAWTPNQDVGLIAASAGTTGYRLYDRWSPQTIEIDVPSGADADTMTLFDMNLWNNNLHPVDIDLKKDASTVWSHSGQFTGRADVHMSSVLDEGLNILSMTQEDFLGGQILVTFPYTIPTVAGDFNKDHIVNFLDLEILAMQWLETPGVPSADIVRDHIINFLDFAGFAENWGVDNRVSQKIVDYTLDLNPGWAYQGQWAFGQPSGSGGANGNPDPSSGYTGDNVYGVNLTGDYSTTAGGPYYLTTGAIDCTGYGNVNLKFARWLNTDFPPYANSKVEASNNGTTWQTVWEQPNSQTITDSDWNIMEYDISDVADNQPTVYIRWSYEIISGEAYPYSGWNIDDVQLWGNE